MPRDRHYNKINAILELIGGKIKVRKSCEKLRSLVGSFLIRLQIGCRRVEKVFSSQKNDMALWINVRFLQIWVMPALCWGANFPRTNVRTGLG